MIGTNKGGGESRPPRPRKSIDYRGQRYSRHALAQLLASEWGRPRGAIDQMLIRCGDDVAAVQARYERPKEGRRRTRASEASAERQPRPGKMIRFEGTIFPSRKALAQHLAPILGRSVNAVAHLLSDRGENAEAVIHYCRHHPPPGRRPQKAVKFEGTIFPSRKALAQHLAPSVGRSVGAISLMLRRYNDDGTQVLAHCRTTQPRKIPVTVNGKTYASKVDYIRDLRRRYGMSLAQLFKLIAAFGPDEALVRAKNYARLRKIRQPKLDRSVVVFGWRWPSFSAMCRYYGVSVTGGALADWEDHLAAGRVACLYPRLAAKLAQWWEAGYLDDRNRFSAEVEARMPRKDLPLNAEPEEVTDPMERSMIDALQPPGVMTIRRSCLKKLQEMMTSISISRASSAANIGVAGSPRASLRQR